MDGKVTDPELLAQLNGGRGSRKVEDPALLQKLDGTKKVYSGGILPFSKDASGKVSFDSNAGILGAIKRAVTLPGEVYRGEVDPRSDEGIERAFEMAGTIAPVNPAIRAGDRAIPGALRAVTRERVAPPTAEALKEAAEAGYTQARGMGVDYASDAVKNVARSIQGGLEQDGVIAELAPKSFGILNKLQSPPEGSVATLSGLDAARRSFGHAAKDFANPTEQMAAGRAREGLDAFLEGSDPTSVVAGPAAEAARVLRNARGNYAAAMRSDKITGIEDAAELRAAAANSGQNLDNSIRSRIASLLLKPKEAAGFSEAELAQLEAVARGTKTSNAFRAVGNLLGGGGGAGATVTGALGGAAGGVLGGPAGVAAGVALPVIGNASKRVANALSRRALNQADETIRMRSPLYEEMVANAPMTVNSPERRAAVMRALLLAEQNQQSGEGR